MTVARAFDTPPTGRIGRADLAQCLVDALGRDDLIRRASFVGEPE